MSGVSPTFDFRFLTHLINSFPLQHLLQFAPGGRQVPFGSAVTNAEHVADFSVVVAINGIEVKNFQGHGGQLSDHGFQFRGIVIQIGGVKIHQPFLVVGIGKVPVFDQFVDLSVFPKIINQSVDHNAACPRLERNALLNFIEVLNNFQKPHIDHRNSFLLRLPVPQAHTHQQVETTLIKLELRPAVAFCGILSELLVYQIGWLRSVEKC